MVQNSELTTKALTMAYTYALNQLVCYFIQIKALITPVVRLLMLLLDVRDDTQHD